MMALIQVMFLKASMHQYIHMEDLHLPEKITNAWDQTKKNIIM